MQRNRRIILWTTCESTALTSQIWNFVSQGHTFVLRWPALHFSRTRLSPFTARQVIFVTMNRQLPD